MADRPGVRYAVTVDNPNTDPVVMALAIRDKGTCEVLIPKDRYDPLAVLAMMEGGEGRDAEPDCLWWRVAIQERARPAGGPWISGRTSRCSTTALGRP